MKARLGLPILLVAMAGAALGDEPMAGDPKSIGGASDLFCGPKCLRHLLVLYGRSAPDLVDLIREVQWPDLEEGATLQSIAESLEHRGIYTKALQIGLDVRITWPHPVLLHLNGEVGGGHYVVWESSEGGRDLLWTGGEGFHREDENAIASRRSGVVLLTSPSPIVDIGSAFVSRSGTGRLAVGVSAAGGFVLATGCFVVVRRRRSRPASGPSPSP